MDEGSQVTNAGIVVYPEELDSAELIESVSRVLLMEGRKKAREGKEMFPLESLPLGNYYCGWCTWPCFVVPVDGVVGEMPVFCENCNWLFANGLL